MNRDNFDDTLYSYNSTTDLIYDNEGYPICDGDGNLLLLAVNELN